MHYNPVMRNTWKPCIHKALILSFGLMCQRLILWCPVKIWGLKKACPCGIYDITLVFILWCCMKVSSCPTLPHSEALLRSCSSSLPSFSLNWKNNLFWRFLSLCQVCMKLVGCSVLFIREGEMEGWMNTDTSSYKPPFQQGQAQRQPLEQGHRSGEGSLLVQYPDPSTTPLFLAQWILKHSTQNGSAFPGGNENATFFLLSCQCH